MFCLNTKDSVKKTIRNMQIESNCAEKKRNKKIKGDNAKEK